MKDFEVDENESPITVLLVGGTIILLIISCALMVLIPMLTS